MIKWYEPGGAPKGGVLVVHGFGEHIGTYSEIAAFFKENGYVCLLFDLRGHGDIAASERGLAKNYDCFLDDIARMRDDLRARYPNLPITLYAHSMGGNIALNYLLKRGQADFSSAIIETPWLRLYKPKPKSLLLISRMLGRISSKITASTALNPGTLTRDPEKVLQAQNDPLRHGRISMRIFAQVTDAGEYAIAHAPEIALPMLLLSATSDKVVSCDATRDMASRMGKNVTYYEEPDGYHALHDDTVRQSIYKRMLDFISTV